jgi:hypothetical protein
MIVQLLMQAAEALDFAHNLRVDGVHAKIVHRDVTPDNLMVSGIGNVFVIDFGIATADAIDWRQRTEGQIIKGKTGYLAPELLHGERADQRTDVYGLGIVATELLTGERAFPQETKEAKYVQIMLGDLPSIRSKNAAVPADLAQFIEKMRHAQRDQRIGSAREVYERLYRLRPSAAAPDVKRQLGALAIEMSAPYRTKSSPWHQAPVVRTLALPVSEEPANSAVVTASSEPNAPQYVQAKASPVEAETHKVANGEMVKIGLAPPPAAPATPTRNAGAATQQDRRQLHHLPTVKLSEQAQSMMAEHLARARKPHSGKRTAAVATLVSLSVAMMVVAAFRVLGAHAGSTQAIVEPKSPPPQFPLVATKPTTPSAPTSLPISVPQPTAPERIAPAAPEPSASHHHRAKKIDTESAISAPAAVVTDGNEDPPSTVGVISVPAIGHEVRYLFVDNVKVGTAPMDYEVMPGRHHVVVTAIDKSGVPVQRFSEWLMLKGGAHRVVGTR